MLRALFVSICLFVASAAWAASDGVRPDPILTPGAVRTMNRDEICNTRTRTVRNVSGVDKLVVHLVRREQVRTGERGLGT